MSSVVGRAEPASSSTTPTLHSHADDRSAAVAPMERLERESDARSDLAPRDASAARLAKAGVDDLLSETLDLYDQARPLDGVIGTNDMSRERDEQSRSGVIVSFLRRASSVSMPRQA